MYRPERPKGAKDEVKRPEEPPTRSLGLPVESAYSRVEQAVAHKAPPDTLSRQVSFWSHTKYLNSQSGLFYDHSD